MSQLKTIGRNRRRALAKFTSLIRAMKPDGVYTLTNAAGQKMTKTGQVWKEGIKEV